MSSQPPLLSSTGFSLFTGNVPLLPESDTELSVPAPKKASPSGADTGFSFSAGTKSSGSSLPETDTESSFSAPRMPSPSALSEEADAGFRVSAGTISARSSLLETETGLSTPAGTRSLGSSLSGSGHDSVADMSRDMDNGKATPPTHDDTTLDLRNQGQNPREQKHRQAHLITEPQNKEREPEPRTLALLARYETPSLATTLYITTLTSFGVILSPTLSIFVHLLSMLSIGSLRQEIRQLERKNREKDETIRRLEEKIVVLEEQERGSRGKDLWF